MFGSRGKLHHNKPTILGGKIRVKETNLAGQESSQGINRGTVQSTKCMLEVGGDLSAQLEGSRT